MISLLKILNEIKIVPNIFTAYLNMMDNSLYPNLSWSKPRNFGNYYLINRSIFYSLDQLQKAGTLSQSVADALKNKFQHLYSSSDIDIVDKSGKILDQGVFQVTGNGRYLIKTTLGKKYSIYNNRLEKLYDFNKYQLSEASVRYIDRLKKLLEFLPSDLIRDQFDLTQWSKIYAFAPLQNREIINSLLKTEDIINQFNDQQIQYMINHAGRGLDKTAMTPGSKQDILSFLKKYRTTPSTLLDKYYAKYKIQ